ncbi:uncharacterized protein [Branchiostoma lanceolatum]|uniref:uncharacterized protein n=1 Tax=Branchiostoma lanceolatum TaxID=7740 RepID=UPI003452DB9F
MIFVFALLVVGLFHQAHGQGQLYPGDVQGFPCLSCDADIIDGVLEDTLCAGEPSDLPADDSINCPIGQYCYVMYKTTDRVLTDITRGCEQTCTETDDCMRDDSADCVRCCNDRNNNSTGCNTWVIDRENLPSGGVRVGEAGLTLLALTLMFGIVFSVCG